jgi:hypothetical protein
VLYFKFPAFNIYGNALQSLADASPVIYTVQSPGPGTTPSLDSPSSRRRRSRRATAAAQ